MTTPQTDRKLLELAAKAAGIDGRYFEGVTSTHTGIYRNGLDYYWNPLISDSEALRLAVKLKIRIGFRPCAYADTPAGLRFFGAHDGDDQFSRTRLAIVRAAAEIGQAMP